MMLNLKLHEYAFEYLKVDPTIAVKTKDMLNILKNMA